MWANSSVSDFPYGTSESMSPSSLLLTLTRILGKKQNATDYPPLADNTIEKWSAEKAVNTVKTHA
jgi:hypothetical protein